jgi:hypothetical protein
MHICESYFQNGDHCMQKKFCNLHNKILYNDSLTFFMTFFKILSMELTGVVTSSIPSCSSLINFLRVIFPKDNISDQKWITILKLDEFKIYYDCTLEWRWQYIIDNEIYWCLPVDITAYGLLIPHQEIVNCIINRFSQEAILNHFGPIFDAIIPESGSKKVNIILFKIVGYKMLNKILIVLFLV